MKLSGIQMKNSAKNVKQTLNTNIFANWSMLYIYQKLYYTLLRIIFLYTCILLGIVFCHEEIQDLSRKTEQTNLKNLSVCHSFFLSLSHFTYSFKIKYNILPSFSAEKCHEGQYVAIGMLFKRKILQCSCVQVFLGIQY